MNRLFAIAVVLLVFCLSSASLAQEELGTPYGELSPDFYLTSRLAKLLLLSEDQERERRRVLSEYLKWHESSLAQIRKPEFPAIREGAYCELYIEFSSILNDDQVNILNQFIRAKYYSILAKEMMPQILPTDLRELSGSVAWVHPELSNVIGVNENQLSQFHGALKGFDKGKEQLENENEIFVKDLFKDWQHELFETLDSFKREKYKNAIGNEFSFDKKTLAITSIAYASGKLPLKLEESQTPMVFRVESKNGPKLFNLANIASVFDGPFQLPGLFEFLQQPNIQREIGITEMQDDLLKSIAVEWYRENPQPDDLTCENRFGLEWRKHQFNENELSDEYKLRETRILGVFDLKQRKRLRQVWNQLVVEFGWRDVPLSHPDWARYLDLSLPTAEKMEQINSQYRKKFQSLVTEVNKREKELIQNLDSSIKQILSEKQKTRLKELFGPFGLMD